MSTIAIVGAGPGLGLSIAKVFGAHDFRVGLIARRRETLDHLVAQLGALGIEAAGFHGDVMSRPSLIDALVGVQDRFGPIDVLEYSPAPHNPVAGVDKIASALEVTVENVQPQLDYYLYGAIAAVGQVLPGMIERGTGTLLFSTGGSSIRPNPAMGNVGIGAAALRNWVLSLHAALADKHVYVAHVGISAWIGRGGPETEPDRIAQDYWQLFTARTDAEHHYVV